MFLNVDAAISWPPRVNSATVIAEAIEAYFDTLGPGEVIDLTDDDRAHRAMRQPLQSEEDPARAGAGVLTFLQEALQAALSDNALDSISSQVPTVPADAVLGPAYMVPGHVGFYPPSTT